MSETGGLQPLGHANAQPTRMSSGKGGSRTRKITKVSGTDRQDAGWSRRFSSLRTVPFQRV